jgi:hypothetical protein
VSAIPLDGVYPCLPPCLLLTATESQIRQIGNHESDQREHALNPKPLRCPVKRGLDQRGKPQGKSLGGDADLEISLTLVAVARFGHCFA